MKRSVVLLGLSLLIIVIIVWVIIFRHHSNLKKLAQAPAPGSFSSAISYGNNSTLFFNGRAFVVYNLSSGQTNLLSPDGLAYNILGNVDSLSLGASNQFIVFHAASIYRNSALGQILAARGVNSSLGSWWIYNIMSKKFNPLPQDVLIAKASGNNTTALTATGSSQRLSTFDSNAVQLSSFSVSGVSNFFPVAGGYLLQSPDNQVSFTSNGSVTDGLFSSTIIYGISADGKTAIGVVSSSSTKQLESLDIKSGSSKILASSIVGQPAWSSNLNSVVYFAGQAAAVNSWTLMSYSLSTGKSTVWRLTKNDVTPLAQLSSSVALVSQSQTNLLLVGQSLPKLQILPVNYHKAVEIAGQSISLSYSTSLNALVINKFNVPGEYQAIYQQLSGDGYDPNLVTIDY